MPAAQAWELPFEPLVPMWKLKKNVGVVTPDWDPSAEAVETPELTENPIRKCRVQGGTMRSSKDTKVENSRGQEDIQS